MANSESERPSRIRYTRLLCWKTKKDPDDPNPQSPIRNPQSPIPPIVPPPVISETLSICKDTAASAFALVLNPCEVWTKITIVDIGSSTA